MEEKPEEWDDDKELTELEKIQLEDVMLTAAYENSYRVLTNKIDFADLVEEKNLIGISAIMAYDPLSGIRKDELENMINFYVDKDEPEYYLRCAELKKIYDEID